MISFIIYSYRTYNYKNPILSDASYVCYRNAYPILFFYSLILFYSIPFHSVGTHVSPDTLSLHRQITHLSRISARAYTHAPTFS